MLIYKRFVLKINSQITLVITWSLCVFDDACNDFLTKVFEVPCLLLRYPICTFCLLKLIYDIWSFFWNFFGQRLEGYFFCSNIFAPTCIQCAFEFGVWRYIVALSFLCFSYLLEFVSNSFKCCLLPSSYFVATYHKF